MNPITWIASYPKSGNTWLRIFLANVLADSAEPVSINAIPFGPIASSRQYFDQDLGLDAADFTADEAEALRPSAYRALARGAVNAPYVKVHDANVTLANGGSLIPADVTARAVYVVRDPRDVAVSFAQHLGMRLDEVIDAMADPGFAYSSNAREPGEQLRQRLLTWSGHVLSWVTESRFPVHVVRYEDLVADPIRFFAGVIRFLELEHRVDRVEQAVRFSSLAELRRQEDVERFREAPSRVERFFGGGRPRLWTETLSGAQATRLAADHREVMSQFAYDTEGETDLASL